MHEPDAGYLADILHYAKAAVRVPGHAEAVELRDDEKTNLALQHAIQTCGEAANRLSDSAKREFPEISRQDVIGMRHRIVHAYSSIRPELLVVTTREHSPKLIVVLEHTLEDKSR